MSFDFTGEQMTNPEQEPNQEASADQAKGTPAEGDMSALLGAAGGGSSAGGMDLGALLGMLGGGGATGSAAGQGAAAGGMDLSALLGMLGGAGGAGGLDLGSLLGMLGGGAGGLDVNGVAEQSGVAPALIQAAIPLVLGLLLQRGNQGRSGNVGLEASGLSDTLASQTGANQEDATAAIQGVLKALGAADS